MTPDSENWSQLQALFHLAESVPPDQLDAALEAACPDPLLRERAKTLILASRQDDAAKPAPSDDKAPNTLRRIGPYTVVKHLGSGGIGTVYLVERLNGGIVQRAALKVLSLHAAGPAFVDRFTREQHILASLEHPNITRMLDAGTNEAGEPYLVMEYVNGVHLDAFCDQRSLPIEDRLKLFLKVGEAIAYAHRNLIVHLDLKPSNILVSETDGTVKVLDFGTSKLIQPDITLTTTIMATPAYASPEQLRNEAVTTACDVYALGAVLFELLAGRRPNLDNSVAIMIERSLLELPAEPLPEAVTTAAAQQRGMTQTRLRNTLSGDLATITAKCLSPRPRDRYASVDALLTDVQRYLDGRPILARPQTTTYRIGKFIRRNRKLVAVTAIACLLLAATTAYAAIRQQQALKAGRRAVQMQSFMYQLFRLANATYMGKPNATVPEFLQLGSKVLPDFITDKSDRRAAQLSLAESMVANGDYHDAAPIFDQVIASAKEAHDLPAEAEAEAKGGETAYVLARTDAGNALTAHALGLAHARGVTVSQRVMIEDTYARSREDNSFRTPETLRILEDAAKESVGLPDRDRAVALNNLALGYVDHGNLVQAESLFRQTLDLYQHEPYALCDEGLVYRYLGSIRSQRQDVPGALAYYQQSYDRLRRCSGDDSLQTLGIQSYMANAMVANGQAPQATAILEAALPRWRKAVGPDSTHIAGPLLFLTRAYIAAGKFDQAEVTARELLRVISGKTNPHSSTMGVCQEALALSLAGEHKYPEALKAAHIAVDAFPEHLNPGETANLAKAKITLQKIQTAMATPPQAPSPH